MSARCGTSVAELLVALSLFGILSLAVVGVLRRMQTVYRSHTQQMDRRQNLRAAAALFPAELRELDATDGDLVAMTPTSVSIRAPRQFAVLCRSQAAVQSGPVSLIVQQALRYGIREFDADTDSLRVLSEALDWIPADVVSVGTGACADGTPGRRVTANLAAPAGLSLGAPVLGFETVTYRLYRSSEDGRWYIGQQTATDFQPVIGPVTANGLTFAYSDASGAPTSDPARVALIEVCVRAATSEPIRDAAGRLGRPVDSVVTFVALRNNRRR